VRILSRLLSFFTRFLVLATLVAGASAGIAFAQEPPKDVPAPPASPAPPTRIRVGGNVQLAKMRHFVQPLYPPIAVAAHITGTVVLHAIVARDGAVQQLEYVSGPPLLMKASMEAVKQWVYEPTTLNGQPVEVDTTISVVFTLGPGTPQASDSPLTSLPNQNQMQTQGTSPARTSGGYVVYPDSVDGIKAQTEAVFKAWGTEYQEFDYFKALHDFAMLDPKAWLTKTFGAERASELFPLYETGFERFEGHMTRVSEYWAKSPTSYLIVELISPPIPSDDTNEEPLPKSLVPLRIETFRFMVKTGQEDPGDWVFSFIYEDDTGKFRGVGGTYPFWDEHWRGLRSAKSIARTVRSPAAQGFQGMAVDCPEPGLLRVFISPKAQALRLKDKVEPVYPEAAKKAGIEGTVLFQAIIAADGTVAELTLEDGDPLLAKAAEQAVRKWRYDKTTHRGRVAEVDTVVAVEFKLPR
jgi:TonB family protein